MRKNLSVDELGYVLNAPLLATLATNYPDGTTLLSPVWFEWRDGGFTIVVWDDDPKARAIKRDPRVTVVVADNRLPCAGIEVRGEATIVPTEPDLGRTPAHGRALHRCRSGATLISTATTRRRS